MNTPARSLIPKLIAYSLWLKADGYLQMKQEKTLKVKGTVLKYLDGIIDIEVQKPVECGDCGVCLSNNEKILRIPTRKNLHKGDTVWLIIACSTISRISFLLYFLPAVFALIGFSLGYLLQGDLGGFSGAIIFLILGYLGIKKYTGGKYKHTIDLEKIDLH